MTRLPVDWPISEAKLHWDGRKRQRQKNWVDATDFTSCPSTYLTTSTLKRCSFYKPTYCSLCGAGWRQTDVVAFSPLVQLLFFIHLPQTSKSRTVKNIRQERNIWSRGVTVAYFRTFSFYIPKTRRYFCIPKTMKYVHRNTLRGGPCYCTLKTTRNGISLIVAFSEEPWGLYLCDYAKNPR